MHVVVIENTGERFAQACREAEAKGLRWACSSTAGLVGTNKVRVTFLPASAFTDTPQGQTKDGMPVTGREPRHVSEFLAESRSVKEG